MSRGRLLEDVPKSGSVRSRHVFVMGAGGELLSWSSRATTEVPAALVRIVRASLPALAAEEQPSFAEIAMKFDERFHIHIIRNAATGPVSYAVIVDEVMHAR